MVIYCVVMCDVCYVRLLLTKNPPQIQKKLYNDTNVQVKKIKI